MSRLYDSRVFLNLGFQMIGLENSSPRKWEYPKYRPGETVALFIPCYIDQLYPEIGRATVRILERLDIPLAFPEKQTCCGQPAFNSGYWDEARIVVEQFCDAFREFDWIVSPSGSCSAMARVFFGHLDSSESFAQVGSRVFELTEFLVEILGVTDLGARFPHSVTMHVGCHTRRELGVLDPPLRLLQAVKDLEYRELPDMEECCGFGGTFSVKMPGTSLAMGQAKAENILKTGAEVVCTPDISCMMHFGGIMKRDPRMKHIRQMHIAEILAGGAED